MSSYSYAQDSIAQLPYSIQYEYPRKINKEILMAKIIDELGYKYYYLTDGLLNDHFIEHYHSKNVPRLLLSVLYQLSESIYNSTTNHKSKKTSSFHLMSYETIRKNTLLNLKMASDKLIKNSRNLFYPYNNSVTTLTSIAESYIDQLILYKEYLTVTNESNINAKQKTIPKSVMFEKQLGGDGITNEQWMAINNYGSSANYFENIRRQKNINVRIITNLRKQEQVKMKVGNPEQIHLSSGTVEDLTYIYFRDPPKQLSYLFSHDEEFLKEMINWIVYINSGNPTKLSEIFKMGLDIVVDIDIKLEGQLAFDNVNYRDFIDNEGNGVRMRYSNQYFDGSRFSDITIDEVHIKKDNQIEFIANDNFNDPTKENLIPIVIQLNNIKGSLLQRIKIIIDEIRFNEIRYNDEILNLGK